MFSHTMPILFPVAGVNFFLMYWMDKYFLLRSNRIPKNYDEKAIVLMLQYLKLAFVFHFIAGLFMLRNGNILQGDEDNEFDYSMIINANKIAN